MPKLGFTSSNFIRCYELCYERNDIAADSEILDPHGQRR